jgi:Ala-tRNA(Pro) deacylase
MWLVTLKAFLDSFEIPYIVISHSVGYTAQGIAALAHISGKELAKTVIVKLDGKMVMAVLPASYHVDLERLKIAAKASSAELASEREFRSRFADCETGAMPPFGNLYGMAVYLDEHLTKDEEIVFNAGTHRELVRMAWTDYQKLVEPKIVRFAAGQFTDRAA